MWGRRNTIGATTPAQVVEPALEDEALEDEVIKDEAVAFMPVGRSSGIVSDGVLAGPVRVFRQKFTLEDTIGSHACSLEANMRVTNGIPLGSSLLLPVHTVNSAQTLKV
jgi:hypothetical protein